MISDSFVDETLDKTKPYPKARVTNITDEYAEQKLQNVYPTVIRKRIIV